MSEQDTRRERLLALAERVNRMRGPKPRVRRLVMLAALAVFVVVTVLAVRDLPPLPAGRRQPALFAVVVVLSALGVVVNGAEYALSARALGGRVGLWDATRVSVLSTAANLLPVPGAAIVKTGALRRGGARLRTAAALTIALGIVWVGVGALVAGPLVAFTAHHGPLAAAMTAGGAVVLPVGIALLVSQRSAMSAQAIVVLALAIELTSVASTALRFYLVLHAIGFGGSLAQGATLGATAIVSSAAGLFPGGLGLREVLSSAVGPAVGLPSAVATVVAAIERIVSLAVVAIMALVVMVADRAELKIATTDRATCA